MKKKFSDIVKASGFTCKILFTNTPVFMTIYCVIRVLLALLPASTILISKRVIDGLITVYNEGRSDHLWQLIALLLTVIVVQSLLSDLSMTISQFMRDKNEKFLTNIIADKLSKIEIYHLEKQDSLNTIHHVMQSQHSFTAAFYTIFSGVLIPIITFVSTLSVIFSYFPLVALLYFITTIPATIISQRQNEKMFQFSIDSIPESRKKDYYYEILTKGHYAKELRLYNLGGTIKEKFNRSWKKIMRERSKIFRRGFMMMNLSTLIGFVGFAGLYVYLIFKTYAGELSVGGLGAFSGSVIVMANCLSGMIGNLLTYKRIYVDLTISVMRFFHWKNEDSGDLPSIDLDAFDIEFQNVTFHYPDTDNMVLDNLSFSIGKGEKAAIIGINGAGKSTIVKLLLRLYEPDSGRILINGKDIRTYDIVSYRKKFSVCFQDIAHYALSYEENIAVTDIERVGDSEAVEQAAISGGLDHIHDHWEQKLSTPLTHMFSGNGVELSGGQWQKVGIARAFFRNAPFIVLDEPSSALDPKAEFEIFSSFSKLCNDKSGIIISHRLSSVMMVDKILFLEDGKIKESGTHEELMAYGGTYAQMYAMQAEKYKTER